MRSNTTDPDRDERYRDEETEDRRFPYVTVPYVGVPAWTGWRTESESDADRETETSYDVDEDEDEGTWLDEGLVSLVLIAGVVLFLIPEPATSGIGIALVAFGVFLWFADWVMPGT